MSLMSAKQSYLHSGILFEKNGGVQFSSVKDWSRGKVVSECRLHGKDSDTVLQELDNEIAAAVDRNKKEMA